MQLVSLVLWNGVRPQVPVSIAPVARVRFPDLESVGRREGGLQAGDGDRVQAPFESGPVRRRREKQRVRGHLLQQYDGSGRNADERSPVGAASSRGEAGGSCIRSRGWALTRGLAVRPAQPMARVLRAHIVVGHIVVGHIVVSDTLERHNKCI